MFWPLCLERKVWNDPILDFIICINLLKRVHRESFHGTFLWQKKKKAAASSAPSPAWICLLHHQIRVHQPQNRSVEWPRCQSLPKPFNIIIQSRIAH